MANLFSGFVSFIGVVVIWISSLVGGSLSGEFDAMRGEAPAFIINDLDVCEFHYDYVSLTAHATIDAPARLLIDSFFISWRLSGAGDSLNNPITYESGKDIWINPDVNYIKIDDIRVDHRQTLDALYKTSKSILLDSCSCFFSEYKMKVYFKPLPMKYFFSKGFWLAAVLARQPVYYRMETQVRVLWVAEIKNRLNGVRDFIKRKWEGLVGRKAR